MGCGASNSAAAGTAADNITTPARVKGIPAIAGDATSASGPRRSRPSTPRNSGGKRLSRGKITDLQQPDLSLKALMAATGTFGETEHSMLGQRDPGCCTAYGISMWALRAFADANADVIGRKSCADVRELLRDATSEWGCSMVDILRANNVWTSERGLAVSKVRCQFAVNSVSGYSVASETL